MACRLYKKKPDCLKICIKKTQKMGRLNSVAVQIPAFNFSSFLDFVPSFDRLIGRRRMLKVMGKRTSAQSSLI